MFQRIQLISNGSIDYVIIQLDDYTPENVFIYPVQNLNIFICNRHEFFAKPVFVIFLDMNRGRHSRFYQPLIIFDKQLELARDFAQMVHPALFDKQKKKRYKRRRKPGGKQRPDHLDFLLCGNLRRSQKPDKSFIFIAKGF